MHSSGVCHKAVSERSMNTIKPSRELQVKVSLAYTPSWSDLLQHKNDTESMILSSH